MIVDKKPKKILVVDDDPGLIKLVAELLKSKAFDVVTAADGLDCMVMVKKEKPDLIVLDIMMPEINGYNVCRNIKFDKEFKETPILLLTSRDQELDPNIGQMMNIDYLHKPLNRELFFEKINQLLGEI